MAGASRSIISGVEEHVRKVREKSNNANSSQRPALLSLLWDFHVLCAKIYGDDMCLATPALTHINAAMELAIELDSADLQASTLYRSSAIHVYERSTLALADIDGALVYAQKGRSHIRGAILVDAALVHATADSGLAKETYVQRLLEQAEKYTDNAVDDGTMNFSLGKYQLIKARSLLALERPGKALECLDEAAERIDPDQRRRLAYLDILRAECYLKLKRPQYDRASKLLADGFAISDAIKSTYNIKQAKRVFKHLSASPYGSAPEVVDLEMSLRGIRL
jgi:tetratricopeptide (TPR) repeat protein